MGLLALDKHRSFHRQKTQKKCSHWGGKLIHTTRARGERNSTMLGQLLPWFQKIDTTCDSIHTVKTTSLRELNVLFVGLVSLLLCIWRMSHCLYLCWGVTDKLTRQWQIRCRRNNSGRMNAAWVASAHLESHGNGLKNVVNSVLIFSEENKDISECKIGCEQNIILRYCT